MKLNEIAKNYDEYDIGWMRKYAFIAGYVTGKYEPIIESFCEKEPNANLQVTEDGIQLLGAKRTELMTFLQCFGGDWVKEINTWDKTKMDYFQKVSFGDLNFEIKVVAVEPPPSCRIVEEDILVPAQPERVEKRKVIKCTEGKEKEVSLEANT